MSYKAPDPANPSQMVTRNASVICPTLAAFETGVGCDFDTLTQQPSDTFSSTDVRKRFVAGAQRYGFGYARTGEPLVSGAGSQMMARFDAGDTIGVGSALTGWPATFNGLGELKKTFLSPTGTYTIALGE